MDTSLTIKPRDSVARAGQGRTTTVRTDLAPAQSVTAVKPSEMPHNPAAAQDAIGRDLVDPQNRDVIYRAREERNRKRASDDALMRQRAYGHVAANGEPLPEPQDPHADIEI